MEKCKFCQGELEEDSTLCPHCGKDNGREETIPVPVAETTEETATEEKTPVTEEAVPAEETPKEEEEKPEQEKTSVVEGKKATPGLIAVAVAAVVILLAALTALVLLGLKDRQSRDTLQLPETTATTEATEETVVATIPADGNPEDVTCKGSYTGSDADALAAMDTVVATMGEHTLTNRQLQVYYWRLLNQQAYQFAMYGYLDPYQGLDTQIYSQTEEMTLTWQHAFLDSALRDWQQEQAMAAAAEALGLEISEEDAADLEELPQLLEEQALGDEYSDAQAMLSDIIGVNTTLEDYVNFCEVNARASTYYNDRTGAMVPTQEELEAYYAENEEVFTQSGVTKEGVYVDVRHILLMIDGGTTDEDGNTTYSDADWEACREKAQAVQDSWLAGEKTEESFALLANEKSEDGGSNTNGGLYENVYTGQMVEEFDAWCFDESRQVGDYGLVKTQFGYHIMYFAGSRPIWVEYAREQWVSEQTSKLLTELLEANPMTVDYSAIVLGNISLVG